MVNRTEPCFSAAFRLRLRVQRRLADMRLFKVATGIVKRYEGILAAACCHHPQAGTGSRSEALVVLTFGGNALKNERIAQRPQGLEQKLQMPLVPCDKSLRLSQHVVEAFESVSEAVAPEHKRRDGLKDARLLHDYNAKLIVSISLCRRDNPFKLGHRPWNIAGQSVPLLFKCFKPWQLTDHLDLGRLQPGL